MLSHLNREEFDLIRLIQGDVGLGFGLEDGVVNLVEDHESILRECDSFKFFEGEEVDLAWHDLVGLLDLRVLRRCEVILHLPSQEIVD